MNPNAGNETDIVNAPETARRWSDDLRKALEALGMTASKVDAIVAEVELSRS